jgi:hypothetical protein
MASQGKENWLKNWKGNDGIKVKIKVSSPYYINENTNKSDGTLIIGQEVIYNDANSQHIQKGGNTKIGFQFLDGDDAIYYSKVDNFIKPGRSENIKLNPSSFGLANRTFSNVTQYYNTVKQAIQSRWQQEKLNGELYDYLIELINFADGGSPNLSGIDTSSFDWGELQSYFAEVIGPIACIKQNLLSQLGITTSNASIFIPPESEKLYDYKLIANSKEYLISAKSGRGSSNQIKPEFIMPYLENISQNLKQSKSYKLLKIIDENSIKQGPFFAWKMIENSRTISKNCIDDILLNYGKAVSPETKIKNTTIWNSFINTHMSVSKIEDVTYGQLRYACEDLIHTASQGTLQNDLKRLFEIYLNVSRIIYVKLTLNRLTGSPSFDLINIYGVKSLNYVEIRSSNDKQRREADKLGYDKVR